MTRILGEKESKRRAHQVRRLIRAKERKKKEAVLGTCVDEVPKARSKEKVGCQAVVKKFPIITAKLPIVTSWAKKPVRWEN